MSSTRTKLEEELNKYIKDTSTSIKTVSEFIGRSSEWISSREAELNRWSEIKERDQEFKNKRFKRNQTQKEQELQNVLKDSLMETLEGLKEMQRFLDAVEMLAVTSPHVFEQNQTSLPARGDLKSVQNIILVVTAICPMLLAFKRDNEAFFKPKLENTEVMQNQLNLYITHIKRMCDGFEQLIPDDLCLDITITLDEGVSDEDVEKMLSIINKLSKYRMDEDSRLLFLFQDKHETFMKTFREPEGSKCDNEKNDNRKSEDGKFEDEKFEDEKSVDEKFEDEKFEVKKSVDEKSVDEKFEDKKFEDKKSVDEKSVDEKSVDEKFVDEKFEDKKSVDEKSVDEKFEDEKSVDEKFEDSKREDRMLQFLTDLEECAVQLDSMKKGAKISSVVGSSVGVTAGILSIVGLALIPVTAGVSLGLVGAGAGLAVASGANSVVTTLTEAGVNHTQKNKANETLEKFMEDVNVLQRCVNDVITQHFLKTQEEFNLKDFLVSGPSVSVVKSVDTIVDVVSAAKGYRASKVASELPELGQVAAKGTLAMSKLARGGLIGLNALFIGLDLGIIVKDSIALSKGSETELSRILRARAALWKSEIVSWQKMYKSLEKGLKEPKKIQFLLREPFY